MHVPRAACKTLKWDMRNLYQYLKQVEPWDLILHCIVKNYGSKFLISLQEALCFILELYYCACFLELYYGILKYYDASQRAIHHVFQSIALSRSGELFLSQSETFKWSDLIRQFNFWTRQIKNNLIKWYIFSILQDICSFSRELY